MRGIIRGTGPAGLLAAALRAALAAVLTGVLAAGCSAGGPAAYRGTAQTCYAFGVQALERHITVTAAPRACSGLGHAQVNEAVARAVRDVAGARHRAAARRAAQREGRYLAQLIGTVPPARPAPLAGPAPLAAAPARQSADSPVRLAALAAWILTAAAGSSLLAGWLGTGGLRRRARAAGVPPAIIVSHFALAIAGLGTWIAFVATDVAALAWIAVGLLLLIAGLGMATLVTGLPDSAAAGGPAGQGPQLATRMAGTATPGAATAWAATAGTAVLGRPRAPVTVIAAHGVLAAATILLVLLAAISAA
jgi:manganese efflux pump family protein